MSQTDIDLDQLLADMAEDVPPVPADFHDKWMTAVRAEAKQAEGPAPASVSQWPRILSVAAVFVFLIGGTFIYRSTRKTVLPENPSVNGTVVTGAAVTEEAEDAEAAVEDAMEPTSMSKAAETAGEAGHMAMDTAGEMSDRRRADSAAEEPSMYMAAGETGEVSSAAEAPMMDTAAEEEPVTEARATASPTAEPPASEANGAAVPEVAPAERSGIGGFFADMGDFLLAVWPYLLIAALPVAIAAGVKKFRKK